MSNEIQAKALHHDGLVTGYPTEMVASKGGDWRVLADIRVSADGTESADSHATLRRVGWLDQRGVVWTEVPSGEGYNGGSYTPLLVDVRES